MRLLLDTHILIWAVAEPVKLSDDVRRALVSGETEILVSAVTAWEIAIKRALGRIVFPIERFEDVMEQMGFVILPIQARHAIAAGGLPRHHDDPFDRMLIAQARVENLVLVSVDAVMSRYEVTVLSEIIR